MRIRQKTHVRPRFGFQGRFQIVKSPPASHAMEVGTQDVVVAGDKIGTSQPNLHNNSHCDDVVLFVEYQDNVAHNNAQMVIGAVVQRNIFIQVQQLIRLV